MTPTIARPGRADEAGPLAVAARVAAAAGGARVGGRGERPASPARRGRERRRDSRAASAVTAGPRERAEDQVAPAPSSPAASRVRPRIAAGEDPHRLRRLEDGQDQAADRDPRSAGLRRRRSRPCGRRRLVVAGVRRSARDATG